MKPTAKERRWSYDRSNSKCLVCKDYLTYREIVDGECWKCEEVDDEI